MAKHSYNNAGTGGFCYNYPSIGQYHCGAGSCRFAPQRLPDDFERNLFNLSKEKTQAPQKEIEIDKIALAKKDLGQKLVGTVIAENPKLRFAFIENRNQRRIPC